MKQIDTQLSRENISEDVVGPERRPPPAPVPLDEAIARFLVDLRTVRRHAEATRDACRRDLTAFLNFVQTRGTTPCVDQIEAKDIYQWLATVEGCAAATVLRRLSALSAFLKVGLVLGYAATNPTDEVERPPIKRKLMPVMTDDDVARLLSVADGPLEKAILLTFATTGVRRSEVTGICY